jgi:hypothetical protein
VRQVPSLRCCIAASVEHMSRPLSTILTRSASADFATLVGIAITIVGTTMLVSPASATSGGAPRLQVSHGLLHLHSVDLNDRLMLVANEDTVAVWNWQTRLMVRRLVATPAIPGEIAGAVVTSDSAYAAAIYVDEARAARTHPAMLVIWRIADGRELHHLPLPAGMPVGAMCSVPLDGRVKLALIPRFNGKGDWDNERPGVLLEIDPASGQIVNQIRLQEGTARITFDDRCARYLSAIRLPASPGGEEAVVVLREFEGQRLLPGGVDLPDPKGDLSFEIEALALSPQGTYAAILLSQERVLTLNLTSEELVGRVDRPHYKVRPEDSLYEVNQPIRAMKFTGPRELAIGFGNRVARFSLEEAFRVIPPGEFPRGAAVVEVAPAEANVGSLSVWRKAGEAPAGDNTTTYRMLGIACDSGAISWVRLDPSPGSQTTLRPEPLWVPEVSGTYVRDVARVDDDEFVIFPGQAGALLQRFSRDRSVETTPLSQPTEMEFAVPSTGGQEIWLGTLSDIRRVHIADGHIEKVPDLPRVHEVHQTLVGDTGYKNSTLCLDVDPDGDRAAWCTNESIRILSPGARERPNAPVELSLKAFLLPEIRIVPGRDRLVAADGNARPPLLLSTSTGAKLCEFVESPTRDSYDIDPAILLTPDGRNLLIAAPSGISIWRTEDCRRIAAIEGSYPVVYHGAAISPRGSRAAIVGTDGVLRIIDTKSWTLEASFAVPKVAFDRKFTLLNERIALSAGQDGALWIWDLDRHALAAQLFVRPGGNWVVVDSNGRFDTSDFDATQGLAWYGEDHPLEGRPLEIYMRDYYEPRLLAKILSDVPLPALPPVTELNRIQPIVRIDDVRQDPVRTDYVAVRVQVQGVAGSSVVGGGTGARDLRIFRNGQLVGYLDGGLVRPGGASFVKEFPVRLPAGDREVRFSAYAFNDDRIKSVTGRYSYVPNRPVVAPRGRAYLITVGVNDHENADWNLRFAANDARQIGTRLGLLIEQQGVYDGIVTVPLIADAATGTVATKANLKAVLDVLAGRTPNPATPLARVPGAARLRQARPDDLVLLSFSGHGYDEAGMFYLLPSDTGAGQGRTVTPELDAHAISNDELSQWIRDIDAGDMAMIIDACHSAASVGDEFRPGPMGSRGFAQLAFDKGMRILAASQSDDVALESDRLEHGLLSYALVDEGLNKLRADFRPRDGKITIAEWFDYGVSRVPRLADELANREVGASVPASDRGFVRLTTGPRTRPHHQQQPAVFDFTKGRRDVVLWSAAASATPRS